MDVPQQSIRSILTWIMSCRSDAHPEPLQDQSRTTREPPPSLLICIKTPTSISSLTLQLQSNFSPTLFSFASFGSSTLQRWVVTGPTLTLILVMRGSTTNTTSTSAMTSMTTTTTTITTTGRIGTRSLATTAADLTCRPRFTTMLFPAMITTRASSGRKTYASCPSNLPFSSHLHVVLFSASLCTRLLLVFCPI